MRPAAETLQLPIEGMTCASCANRIEKRLNSLDGVEASVNYATEAASVEYDPGAVGSRPAGRGGRGRRLPRQAAERRAAGGRTREADPLVLLRRRTLFAAALALPVFLMSMIPALQFDNWQWLSLQLATPVVLWAGWPFHKAAWQNLKPRRRDDGHADQRRDPGGAGGGRCTPCSSAARGMTGMTMPFELLPERGGGSDEIYLEVAAVVTAFMLAGRYFEARAKRRAGAALQALLELGAKDVSVLDDGGAERRIAGRGAGRRASASSSVPERRSPPTGSSRTATRRSTTRC